MTTKSHNIVRNSVFDFVLLKSSGPWVLLHPNSTLTILNYTYLHKHSITKHAFSEKKKNSDFWVLRLLCSQSWSCYLLSLSVFSFFSVQFFKFHLLCLLSWKFTSEFSNTHTNNFFVYPSSLPLWRLICIYSLTKDKWIQNCRDQPFFYIFLLDTLCEPRP